ncbi:hypothetical protein [Candidatus Harpocratesius sp.]
MLFVIAIWTITIIPIINDDLFGNIIIILFLIINLGLLYLSFQQIKFIRDAYTYSSNDYIKRAYYVFIGTFIPGGILAAFSDYLESWIIIGLIFASFILYCLMLKYIINYT